MIDLLLFFFYLTLLLVVGFVAMAFCLRPKTNEERDVDQYKAARKYLEEVARSRWL